MMNKNHDYCNAKAGLIGYFKYVVYQCGAKWGADIYAAPSPYCPDDPARTKIAFTTHYIEAETRDEAERLAIEACIERSRIGAI